MEFAEKVLIGADGQIKPCRRYRAARMLTSMAPTAGCFEAEIRRLARMPRRRGAGQVAGL
jgi:hypothetical protein